ncbi:hypothetical protein CEXT_350321 [Caerostris extrusa]|uniref:Uncharacterized protein n=1 Tax=Caerostris extrusa TaxID=172846 RepID=A0AAV4Y2T6_CAEEX|nr:hypothetical protein CEXT_350321 [Caerostris extrusa]
MDSKKACRQNTYCLHESDLILQAESRPSFSRVFARNLSLVGCCHHERGVPKLPPSKSSAPPPPLHLVSEICLTKASSNRRRIGVQNNPLPTSGTSEIDSATKQSDGWKSPVLQLEQRAGVFVVDYETLFTRV